MADPRPASVSLTELRLNRGRRILTVSFNTGESFDLPCEYLRVFSPSAEVMGHGPGEQILVAGKEQVNIESIVPVGNYAYRLVFDDGHDTGLFTAAYFHKLARQQISNWADYLERLRELGIDRSH